MPLVVLIGIISNRPRSFNNNVSKKMNIFLDDTALIWHSQMYQLSIIS